MLSQQAHRPSPFLSPGSTTAQDSLAILQLKRDHFIPTVLQPQREVTEGYDEGKVTNTRFGSFPHSTLVGVPWGSQVRASIVDTGSRGRRAPGGRAQKRKRDEGVRPGIDTIAGDDRDEVGVEQKAAVTAPSGFAHILPPTPEIWTTSLPHRTQVVYTPDYSYILHRLRARPGTVLLEAGAGSGSFTHAAARAAFNGYPDQTREEVGSNSVPSPRFGKIWSFEFHEQRVQKLKLEINEHGLDRIVEIIHRDVCQDGFQREDDERGNLNATAIFLDLPAPWLALRHLTRKAVAQHTSGTQVVESGKAESLVNEETADIPQIAGKNGGQGQLANTLRTRHSQTLLDPNSSVHLCAFSPCIEQVQRTITTLRHLGWVDIEMVEIAAKRIEIRRERIGLHEEGLRGVNPSPASVDEALTRLRELEGCSKNFHGENLKDQGAAQESLSLESTMTANHVSKQQRLESIKEALSSRKLYKEGRLVHKTEPELKAHTSYLVFAILPREWTAADELAAQQQWPAKVVVKGPDETSMSSRQRKKAAKAKADGNKAVEAQTDMRED